MKPPHPPECSEEGLSELPPFTDARIAEIAKALGHPARIGIVEQFEDCRPRTVHEIAEHFPLAQSTVSEHLRILREADILFATHDGPRVWYCLRRSVLAQYADAVGDLSLPNPAAG